MHLFSNASQMMSKCWRNKKVAHKPLFECAIDVLVTKFWHHLWSITEHTHNNMEYFLDIIMQKQKNVNDVIYMSALNI